MRRSGGTLPLRAVAVLLGCLIWPAVGRAGDLSPCLDHTDRVEAQWGLPRGLLAAIATVESGRTIAAAHIRVPWPWTINADGRGMQFATKAEAIAETRRLARAGARNIDVGCMQISLAYHPFAFKTIEEAFDPAANIAYGAKFLSGLRRLEPSLAEAVGRYHSDTPALKEEYRDRVMAVWKDSAGGKPLPAPIAFRVSPVPDYPDPAARRLDALAALRLYRQHLALMPDDPTAAFGLAVATDRLARLRQIPDADARAAYARVLALEPGNKRALGRLLGLVADEAPERQLALLQQAYVIAGGPAGLASTIADLAQSTGDAAGASLYRKEAKRLAALAMRR